MNRTASGKGQLRAWRCGLLILFVLALVGLPVAALNRGQQAAPDDTTFDDVAVSLQEWLPRALDSYHVPGAALALVEGDGTLALSGAGKADLVNGVRVDAEHTAFNAPAFGRLLAAIAVLQLASQGKLSILAPITALPDGVNLPVSPGEPLSLAHLLTNSSGLGNPTVGTMRSSAADVPPLAAALGNLALLPQVAPETIINASSYATALAAALVERASGSPYSDYVEANILRPMAMDSSSLAQPLPLHVAEMAATGYAMRRGKPQALPDEYYMLPAADGLYLSAADGAALLQALLTDGSRGTERILAADQVSALLDTQFSLSPDLPGETLAFDELWLGSDRLLELASSSAGFSEAMLLWPERNLGLVLLYNSSDPALYAALKNELFTIMGIGLAQTSTAPSRLSSAYSRQVAGFYQRLPTAVSGTERTRLLFGADPQAELHVGVTAAGIIELTPGRYAGWVQRGSGVFSDMSQQNWLSLPSPD
ncbi:MAG: serine hydrolase domain-containing protein, partial [Anaerolineae bacterium]